MYYYNFPFKFDRFRDDKVLLKKNLGSRVESEVAFLFQFSHIRMMGYFRLGYSRVNECPAGIELPAGARNTRKAAVKIRRNK